MDYAELEKLLTVAQVAEMHEVPARVVRKAAKEGSIQGAHFILKKWGFDPELVSGWKAPEPGVFGARAPKRDDGRTRYQIYLTVEESATLLSQGFEITDPRVAAKERRAARKAAKEAGTVEVTVADEDDPFAGFAA